MKNTIWHRSYPGKRAFRVPPTSLHQVLSLFLVPDGKLNLFFWENRMRRFFRHHGFALCKFPYCKRG